MLHELFWCGPPGTFRQWCPQVVQEHHEWLECSLLLSVYPVKKIELSSARWPQSCRHVPDFELPKNKISVMILHCRLFYNTQVVHFGDCIAGEHANTWKIREKALYRHIWNKVWGIWSRISALLISKSLMVLLCSLFHEIKKNKDNLVLLEKRMFWNSYPFCIAFIQCLVLWDGCVVIRIARYGAGSVLKNADELKRKLHTCQFEVNI